MIKIALFFLIFACADALSANLPVEHESVRLMLAIESSVESSDWELAAQQLNALAALKTDLPDDYAYFNGLVNLKLNHFSESEKNLESYIVGVGQKGKHYVEALKLITLLGREEKNRPTLEAPEVESSSVLSSEERSGYIKSLQALYLTDDPVKALVMQINSLLSVHAYTGLRVKKANVRTGLMYSVSVNDERLGLQEKNYESGFPSLTATKLDVHGLDPFLRYECKKQKFTCTIYHPADAHLVWIKIDNDDLVARELVEALTKLIQHLQVR
jgi:hypothetical protein